MSFSRKFVPLNMLKETKATHHVHREFAAERARSKYKYLPNFIQVKKCHEKHLPNFVTNEQSNMQLRTVLSS